MAERAGALSAIGIPDASHGAALSHARAAVPRGRGVTRGRLTINRPHQKGGVMSAINSQSHGDVGHENGGANGSSGEAMVPEQLIAQVLGRAHCKAVANDAPHEARAILHVAHSFAGEQEDQDSAPKQVRRVQ
jgi:hypothetical protein